MKHEAKPHQRLTARVLLFLTLALVPLGIIGMIQNQRLNAEIEKRSELTLLALTEQAVSSEKSGIQRIFGAARALDSTIAFLRQNPVACSEALSQYVNARSQFTFVGFIEMNGISTCSSMEGDLDFSQDPLFEDLVENPRRALVVREQTDMVSEPSLVFERPYIDDSGLEGFVTISLPISAISDATDHDGPAQPVTLVTFNADGEILTTENDRQRAEALLPVDVSLVDLARGNEARTIKGVSRSGKELVYAVIPIVPNVAYALGSWAPDTAANGSTVSPFVSALLPFLMWLASLFVAWFVIDRFVVQRIKLLNKAMMDFAATRKMPAAAGTSQRWDELAEISELQNVFGTMARDITRDEALQEDRLREKTILLKEVHHRVKNNLQIISSIMNMQIRKSQEPETKRALTQVQDRILGLSGVHRTLYQAENLTQVNAAKLIEQLVAQSRAIGTAEGRGVDIQLDLDPVIIFPDQAVPLTMLVSEALTNGMKYVGGDAPAMSVSLKLTGARQANLVVHNTCCGMYYDPEGTNTNSTGLGKQLIRAFVAQLNGTLNVEETVEQYLIDVTFEVETFRPETPDF